MVICECGRIHSLYNGKRGKQLREALEVILEIKGEFQAADAIDKLDMKPTRVNSILSQMRKAGILTVSGAAISRDGRRACFTYKVTRKKGA